MKRINSLSDLWMEEMADLLSAENQWKEVLPKMAQISQSSALKAALEDNLEITTEHVNHLRDIFNNIGQKPSDRKCKAMQGFIADIEDVVNDPQRYPSRDNAITKVTQRVESFEINGYRIAREHAIDLGHTSIVEVLDKSLNELRAMNFHFNELSQGMINAQTLKPCTQYLPDKEKD